MKTERLIAWSAGVIAALVIGVYGKLIWTLHQEDPMTLLAHIQADPPLTAWTSRQILLHDSFTPDQIAQLNHEGGALYPVLSDNLTTAEEMLSLFIAHGVDINAGDERTRHWTALHTVAMEGSPERVTLLMKHGARVDVRDADGRTPLDFAREMQQKHPTEPNRAEVVRRLEETEKQPSAQK